MRIVLGAAVAMLALAAPRVSAAQSVPSLSGTWILQVDKSDFGPMPPPASRTDVIDHQEPKLTIKRTVVSVAGTNSTELVLAVDGKPYKNAGVMGETVSTLHWDGQTLVIVNTVESPQGQFTATDRVTLSSDGKTMNVARVLSIAGQEVTQTLVLAKQP